MSSINNNNNSHGMEEIKYVTSSCSLDGGVVDPNKYGSGMAPSSVSNGQQQMVNQNGGQSTTTGGNVIMVGNNNCSGSGEEDNMSQQHQVKSEDNSHSYVLPPFLHWQWHTDQALFIPRSWRHWLQILLSSDKFSWAVVLLTAQRPLNQQNRILCLPQMSYSGQSLAYQGVGSSRIELGVHRYCIRRIGACKLHCICANWIGLSCLGDKY